MAALLQRVMAGREEQKKQRQMDLERLLQRLVLGYNTRGTTFRGLASGRVIGRGGKCTNN